MKKILLLLILIYLIISMILFSQTKMIAKISNHGNLEIFMHTANAENQTVEFQVTVNADKPIWSTQSPYLIATESFRDPASLTIEGNDTSSIKGWHTDSDDRIYDNNPTLQRTYEYTIKVSGKNNQLKVKTLGRDFNGDVDVMYNYQTDKYYYWQHSTKTLGDEIASVLDMYDSPDYLQPTPPQNFHCTNPTAYGQHPHFEWAAPEEPEDVTFKYKIYRKDGADPFALVASDFTDLSWTDLEVNIEPKATGILFIYYAKAYTDQAPDSNPSESARISGLYVEKQTPQLSTSDELTSLTALLSCYPNPFNPTTNISYQHPKDGYVHITVYNLAGQRIAELANGNQSAGFYQLAFNGQALAGGIYLVRMQLADQVLMRKILLLK